MIVNVILIITGKLIIGVVVILALTIFRTTAIIPPKTFPPLQLLLSYFIKLLSQHSLQVSNFLTVPLQQVFAPVAPPQSQVLKPEQAFSVRLYLIVPQELQTSPGRNPAPKLVLRYRQTPRRDYTRKSCIYCHKGKPCPRFYRPHNWRHIRHLGKPGHYLFHRIYIKVELCGHLPDRYLGKVQEVTLYPLPRHHVSGSIHSLTKELSSVQASPGIYPAGQPLCR